MRILYHHRTQGRNVEAVHILGLVNSWRSVGHIVDIISPPGVAVHTGSLPNSPSKTGGVFSRLSRRVPEVVFELMELLYNIPAVLNIIRALRANKYDLVFERYATLNWAGLFAAKMYGIPFFLEVNYTSQIQINRRRSTIFKSLESTIDNFLFRHTDGFFAVSSYLVDYLMSLGVPSQKTVLLPNAADPSVFRPDAEPAEFMRKLKSAGKTVVGFVGSFIEWHGVELLVDTIAQVRQKYDNVVYLLIGSGPLRDTLMRKVQSQGLEQYVHFIDRIAHDSVPSYLAAFDVAVMPHSNEFGSPMKILEYMSAANPVVAPRLGPICDVISDGETGVLFEPLNRESLAESIAFLLADERRRQAIGRKARNLVIEKHNWQKNAAAVLNYFENHFGTNARAL